MGGRSIRSLPPIIGLALIGPLIAEPARAQPINPDQPAGLPVAPEEPTAQPAPEIRPGDLRSMLTQLPAPQPTGPTRAWTIVPSLGLQEMATDNVFLTPNGRRADLITTISPGILVNGDTQRLHATLSYTPQFQVYAFTPGQNNIVQQLNAQALVEVVPNWLFVNAQAFATQQAISGGFAPSGTPVLPPQDRANTNSFTISPYLSHTFDGVGTAQLGYAFNYTSQSGATALQPTSSLPFFVNGNLYSNEEFAKFATGGNFGRVNNKVLLDAVQNTGFGILQNSHQNFYTDVLGYALNRFVSLLVEGGYEQIAYPNGLPPVRIDDLVWGGGIKLQPNPDSTIIALYRHLYGFNAPYLDAAYALTRRTRIYANYSEVLGTETQILQDTLAQTTLGQNGTPLDYQTGAPVLLTNQLLGVQNGLTRQKRLSVTMTTSFERDTVSLTALHQSQSLVSVSPGTSGFSQNGTSAGITWTHALTPVASSSVYAQYGTVSSSAPGVIGSSSGPTFTAAVSLAYSFSESLTGSIQYILTNGNFGTRGGQPFPFPSQSVLQNIVVMGLLKRF